MNEEIKRLGLMEDEQIVLDEAALALASPDHPGTDLLSYRDTLDAIAAQLADYRDRQGGDLQSAHDQALLLAAIIAGQRGFRGDAEDYDNPANADLISVMDRQRGMPIALSILYVALARRSGWRAEGLNIPGHLLVRIGSPQAHVVIDPFNGGVLVKRQVIADLLAPLGAAAPAPEAVPALSNREMLLRLLRNQASRAQQAGNLQRALTVYRRMTAVAPSISQLWWDRAKLERQLGHVNAARESLIAMLETTRDPNECKRIRAELESLTRSLN